MLEEANQWEDRNLLIRDAAENDMLHVHRIYSHYVLHGMPGSHVNFEEEPPPLKEIARRHRDVVARGLPYLVAELDSEVVGYSYVAPFLDRSTCRFTVKDSVYVQGGLSGHGIGKKLLSILIERCRKLGLRQMIAGIVEGNPASFRLHESFGFQIIGRFPEVAFKSGEWLSLVYMQRAIT
jgi:L-amino acid N-acyltransferase YncA